MRSQVQKRVKGSRRDGLVSIDEEIFMYINNCSSLKAIPRFRDEQCNSTAVSPVMSSGNCRETALEGIRNFDTLQPIETNVINILFDLRHGYLPPLMCSDDALRICYLLSFPR